MFEKADEILAGVMEATEKDVVRRLVDHALLGRIPSGQNVPAWFYDWAAHMEPGEMLRTRFRFLPGGRKCICIVPYLYTRAILYGDVDDDGSHEDRWCFHDVEKASKAFDEWQPEFDADGRLSSEPTGWHRHPNSDRIRPDGDPARETVGYRPPER